MSGILKIMTFEILTMLAMMMVAFWVVTPCEPVQRYQSFRGTYCPEDGSGIFLKHLYLPTSLQSITTQETTSILKKCFHSRPCF
jgi:hypothetical protein